MDANRLLEAVKTMPLGEVYAFAIEREREAQQFYLDAKQVVADLGAKAMLNDLYNEEVQHEKMLSKACEVGEIEIVGTPRGFADLGLAEMMPDVNISDDSSPQDILIRAMKKEAFAAEFYAAAAASTDLPQAQRLFAHLSVEERQHKGMLETWYDDHILTDN